MKNTKSKKASDVDALIALIGWPEVYKKLCETGPPTLLWRHGMATLRADCPPSSLNRRWQKQWKRAIYERLFK